MSELLLVLFNLLQPGILIPLLGFLVFFVVGVEVVYVVEKTIRSNRLPLWLVGSVVAVLMIAGGVVWAVVWAVHVVR